MNRTIQWSGNWTPMTLVELTNRALKRAFPRCRGIELEMGFSVERVILDIKPSNRGNLYVETFLIGRTRRHGAVVMRLRIAYRWPAQQPTRLTIRSRDQEICFVIRTRKPVSKPRSKK